jgi:CubicO group peptidase (beta-lactamase class C family)
MPVMTDAPTIDGDVAPGWEPVADAFRRNFTESNELGAGVGVYADGKPVVDLWGGVADKATGRPWERDTVVIVFSSTKGATALCAHMLVEQGSLDLDAPVVEYWPEFGQAGKEHIPVRWLLTHQAGLPTVDVDLTFDDLQAHEPVIRALEAQAPYWEPGTHISYHAVTYGHLVGEVVKRITGRSLGTFFAEEVAAPLGLQSWIGLPESVEPRVALMVKDMVHDETPLSKLFNDLAGEGTFFARSITLGSAVPLAIVNGDEHDANHPAFRKMELGGSSMVTDARSLARMYAATVGDVDGVRLLSPETLDVARRVQTADVPYFGLPASWAGLPKAFDFALGFGAPAGLISDTSFGNGGAGGSLGIGDVKNGIGFGYAMNRMDATSPDLRAASLVAAVRSCL